MTGPNPAQDPLVLRFEYNARVLAHLLDVPLRFVAGVIITAHAVYGPGLAQKYAWWDYAVRGAGLLATFGLAGLTIDRGKATKVSST